MSALSTDEENGGKLHDMTARMGVVVKKSIRFPDMGDDGPKSSIANTKALLKAYGVKVRFNLMTHDAEHEFADGFDVAADLARGAAQAQVEEWACEHGVWKDRRFANQMCLIIARDAYHPVADWIRSLPWDGVDRFGDLFATLTLAPRFRKYAGIAKRCLDAWLITGAKAALLPAGARQGIASQGVLVLQGEGGKGKSRWFLSLVPPKSGWAKTGVALDTKDKDSRMQATATFVVELGELDGSLRANDVARVKAFLTNDIDTYRRPYAKTFEDIARRTLFGATTNENKYLIDDTGSRRYYSIAVIAADHKHKIDMQQLWAQAAHYAETDPELGWLSVEEDEQLAAANRAFEVMDPMADDVVRLFKINKTLDKGFWMNFEQIRQAIRPNSSWPKHETIALGRALTKLKCPERTAKGGARKFALERRSKMES